MNFKENYKPQISTLILIVDQNHKTRSQKLPIKDLLVLFNMIKAIRYDSTEITTKLLNMAAQAKRFSTEYYVTLNVTMIKAVFQPKLKKEYN